MHGPPNQHMGIGMRIFAVVTALLAIWLGFVQGAWSDATLWFAVAIFLSCFSALLGDAPERWHRPLVTVGVLAGVIAFVLALRMVDVRLW